MPRILIVTDSIYNDAVIAHEQGAICRKLLARGMSEKVIELDSMDEPWKEKVTRRDLFVVLSPLVSRTASQLPVDTKIVSLAKGLDGASVVADRGDEDDGWKQLADWLHYKGDPIYLIDSKAWTGSLEKADAFEAAFGTDGLTRIDCEGDELQVYADDLAHTIGQKNVATVVVTGSKLLSLLSSSDTSLQFCVGQYQYASVPRSALSAIVADDLPDFLASLKDGDSLLHQKVIDLQGGFRNWLQLSLQAVQEKLF